MTLPVKMIHRAHGFVLKLANSARSMSSYGNYELFQKFDARVLSIHEPSHDPVRE
jgi:hypothetical protein